jgi:uncharacterized membrane protein
MPADQTTPEHACQRPHRFQFSLRSMLLMVSLAAVCCSGLFSGYGWLAGLTGLFIVVAAPVILVIALVYGRGNLRTFCIGALFPSGMALATLSSATSTYMIPVALFGGGEEFDVRAIVVAGLTVYFAAIIGCGLLALWVRRMVEPVPSVAKGRPDGPFPNEPQGPFA